MCLKEAHVVVLACTWKPNHAQWQQRCYELHYEFLCVRCHKRWIPIRSMGCVLTH
jgi:hypothetical protein